MLRQDTLIHMLILHRRRDNIISALPKVLIRYKISNVAFDPNSDVAKLLHFGAYGDLDNVIIMLNENPRLLLEAGDVVDIAGNTIKRVTIYELFLGAGDPGAAEEVGKCFANIKDIDGEKERARQYARYEDEINKLPDQKPDFDFASILKTIKEASNQDVTEELKTDDDPVIENRFNPDYQSPLRIALEQMRKHFDPRVIKNGMHFNYANLLEALKVYVNEFNNLKKSGNEYDKCELFLCQIIGYIQRGLPACDRQAFAQGIYYIVEDNEKLKRSFDFRFGGGSFPVTSGDHTRSDLGYKFAAAEGWRRAGDRGLWASASRYWKIYVKQKHQTYKTYAATPTTESFVHNLLK